MINSEWIEKLRAAAAMCRSQDDDLDYKYWAAVAFDMLPKASGHITELEAQVAALKEIAVGLVATSEYETENWSMRMIPWEEISVEWAEHYKNKARHQLAKEHPEAFRW